MTNNKIFLQNLNWERDQGIQLGMINGNLPPNRNIFYDNILKTVAGKKCIEIGFGTGLLSVIAIHNGAEHIEAWEQDFNRFLLGQYVIDKLGLQQKISLHHGMYNRSDYSGSDRLVFHEIIGPNLWNEGMRQAIPINASCILPGGFCVELDVLKLKKTVYELAFLPIRQFQPRLPYLDDFAQIIQDLIDQTPQKNHLREDLNNKSVEYQELESLPFYNIDLNKKILNNFGFDCIPADFEQNYKFELDQDDVYLLYPHNTIFHNNINLHWGWYKPIVIQESGTYTIVQNFDTGEFISYKVD